MSDGGSVVLVFLCSMEASKWNGVDKMSGFISCISGLKSFLAFPVSQVLGQQ